MADKRPETFSELMGKVEEFERTVSTLLANIKKFKTKLQENKRKYGADTSKWPANTEGLEMPKS
jgi:hypothetical protein